MRLIRLAHTPHLFQTVAPVLTVDTVNGEIIETLLALARDPIPNIRFNVAKSLEVLATTFGNTPEGKQMIQQKVVPVLEAQKGDPDADVRFFATKALQTVRTIDAGE